VKGSPVSTGVGCRRVSGDRGGGVRGRSAGGRRTGGGGGQRAGRRGDVCAADRGWRQQAVGPAAEARAFVRKEGRQKEVAAGGSGDRQ
jgi:hypothetical protein